MKKATGVNLENLHELGRGALQLNTLARIAKYLQGLQRERNAKNPDLRKKLAAATRIL